MKVKIDNLSIFRITNRRAQALVERIIDYGLTRGSGRRPLRSFRVIEVEKPDGSDYFVGLKLNELEFRELTFTPETESQV